MSIGFMRPSVFASFGTATTRTSTDRCRAPGRGSLPCDDGDGQRDRRSAAEGRWGSGSDVPVSTGLALTGRRRWTRLVWSCRVHDQDRGDHDRDDHHHDRLTSTTGNGFGAEPGRCACRRPAGRSGSGRAGCGRNWTRWLRPAAAAADRDVRPRRMDPAAPPPAVVRASVVDAAECVSPSACHMPAAEASTAAAAAAWPRQSIRMPRS